MKSINMKRLVSFLIAITIIFSGSSIFSQKVSAISYDSKVATSASWRLPITTFASPLSGASRIYAYSDSSLSKKQSSYYINTFSDQIVIRQISSNGAAVFVRYPSSSTASGYRDKWFRTVDVIGMYKVCASFAAGYATGYCYPYTAPSKLSVYRMSSSSKLTGCGSIAKNDSCVALGLHKIGTTDYCATIYPISATKVLGIICKNKISLAQYYKKNPDYDLRLI